ncbi:MAG TPA: acyl-CoA dehydrogenase family protein [Acidimicrobiales bacterium]|nr:acyl-CoA dehydrogenase family protein [Acidimicrobiales bacterium]
MDLTYPPDAEEFRGEIRAWLEENLPDGWFDDGFAMTTEERRKFHEEWTQKLFDGGWICASWPKEYGGKGLSIMQNVVLNEEFARAGAPLRADFFGDTLVGPTILQWGNEEQKKEFLPKILSGQIAWCQGFSEPDAGSDLAGLKTKAELDGDEWVINGQKIWTTQAQYADYIFLLARTDPSAPKHAGISYLLVPMKQDGIEVRPIVQPDGSAEFNEVFFTNVRAPKENVVGGLNNGWKVAMTTLGFERGSSATTSHRRFEKELEQIIGKARDNGAIGDPTVRQQLAKQWSKIQIMRINGYRTLTAAVHDKKDLGVAALGATNKMFWSESHRDTMNLAMDILGPYGQILTGKVTDEEEFVPGYGRRHGRADYPVSITQASFFFSRSETIWGGTAEIQRNIVGERVLGLPKEPKPS